MKLFSVSKDGGPESSVTAYWLIELKWLFSVVLLKFDGESRDAYHTHAFNSVSWLLKGWLLERELVSKVLTLHTPGVSPIVTKRATYHKVDSTGVSWVLSFRGPWSPTWKEYLPAGERTLTHGRFVVCSAESD